MAVSREKELNAGAFAFLNSCSADELRVLLTAKIDENLEPEKKKALEALVKMQDVFNAQFNTPAAYANYSEMNDEFLDKILSIELDDDCKFNDIDVNTFLSGMIHKFGDNTEYKQITGKQIKKLYATVINQLNEKFCKFASMQICQNIISYFIRTKINSNISNVILTNPFSAITLFDFMQEKFDMDYDEYNGKKDSEFKRKELGLTQATFARELKDEFSIDLNTKAFSYLDEYNKRKADYDSIESADLVFYNRFIKDTNLEYNCNLSKETNLFSLNEFLISSGFKSDFLTLTIQTQENTKKNILPTSQNKKIEELQNLADELQEKNKKMTLENESLQEKAQIDKEKIEPKELLSLLFKQVKKKTKNILNKVKDI